jgi:hypothetical protein
MAALSVEQKEQVRAEVRTRLSRKPMYAHELVDAIVEKLNIAEHRRSVSLIVFQMTRIIVGGPDDGKLELDEPATQPAGMKPKKTHAASKPKRR